MNVKQEWLEHERKEEEKDLWWGGFGWGASLVFAVFAIIENVP